MVPSECPHHDHSHPHRESQNRERGGGVHVHERAPHSVAAVAQSKHAQQ